MTNNNSIEWDGGILHTSGENIHVLDHGFVRFIEGWGHGEAFVAEAGIIEAARQSTQGSFRGWEKDAKLLATLYNSDPKHATPFEFAGMVIEVQAPIFVFREWHRHRTQSYNEMSARYTPLPPLYYVPDYDVLYTRVLAAVESKNRQVSSEVKVPPLRADVNIWIDKLRSYYADQEYIYEQSLALGIPKELARLTMPVGHYSKMRASGNLRNWLAFLTLRMDPGAQWEIRQYANALAKIVEEKFPRTWNLFSLESSARAERKSGGPSNAS